MPASISGSVGSYESGARNNSADVRTVQELLASVARKHGAAFDPQGIDGKIARPASRSRTVGAIVNFQQHQVGMARPDGRIDVNGSTWKKLVALAGPPAPKRPAASAITLTVTHGGKIPTKTKFAKDAAPTADGMYESTFTLSGGLSGTFRGSIYPDDMTVKGRVVDGTYPLHIGFHKGGTAARQGADKLKVMTSEIRPGLLVSARNSVPVQSDNAGKTTSAGINVHNGFNGNRGSDGCLTLQPSDWPRFMQLFLDAFPDIDDWHEVATNTGKKIGALVIKP
jgi:hypothetical protein